MGSKIYLYYSATSSFGVNVIIDQFLKACERNSIICRPITSLDNISKDNYIIPYGIMEAWEMRNKGYLLDTVFLVDAISLGFINMVRFLLKKGRVFNWEFRHSLLAFIKYRYEEYIISKESNKVMVVAKADADYLRRISKSNAKFIVVPNGANFPEKNEKVKGIGLRLGILSSWSSPRALEENKWFLDTYFPKFAKRHPDVKLYLAGRGPLINVFKDREQVEILGEVNELNEFFSRIDIFLSVNPKGCGILNRVLDAFAHKTAVVGIKPSFSGFDYMQDGSYLSFSDYKGFEESIEKLGNDAALRERIQNTAFAEINKHNQWDANYNKLIEQIGL